ncbi:MAG: hypothetical protein EVG15_08860 [Candidatus Acididesulfobacter diazotrophicus]|jgi:hypothetical protein|uniref:Uncharacterized protein n=1 Tax=Candidatus Acididesulfobacter diazotrophicus TaxID=2597226 RepID=A0A519BKU8_9DELT|nr:MAG: hypothetical protein EVG15_08860 [Candidatus Acididesulfobacter diazotrophicus]
MKKYKITLLSLFLILLFSVKAFSFGIFNIPYNKSDSNFNKLAMRVYNSNSPYIYSSGAYTYNAMPITTTMSGCKIIAVIKTMQNFGNKNTENYKICGGNISRVENTNPAGWNNLPNGIKPVINNVIAETRQYGKATANYNGYRVVGTAQSYNSNTVYVYVLNGIKLEAMMRV